MCRGLNLHPFCVLTDSKDMRLLERLEHGVYEGVSTVEPSTVAQYCAGVNRDVQSIMEKVSKGEEAHV